MLPWLGLVIGAVIGFLVARKRRGNGFDIAQYTIVFAIIGWVVAYLITLIVLRLG